MHALIADLLELRIDLIRLLERNQEIDILTRLRR
jgi:hypothetical protein